MSLIDETGNKYGRLLVIKRDINNSHKNAFWLCECECGQIKVINGQSLRNGETKSCGCLQREKAKKTFSKLLTKHGMCGTKIYNVWKAMTKRCRDKNEADYKYYGGKGIKVCSSWLHSFKNFYKDMGDSYVEGLTLDRINPSGNYEPDNCRWATWSEQRNNQRRMKGFC